MSSTAAEASEKSACSATSLVAPLILQFPTPRLLRFSSSSFALNGPGSYSKADPIVWYQGSAQEFCLLLCVYACVVFEAHRPTSAPAHIRRPVAAQRPASPSARPPAPHQPRQPPLSNATFLKVWPHFGRPIKCHIWQFRASDGSAWNRGGWGKPIKSIKSAPFSTGNQPESSSFDGFDGGPPASDAVDADALDADATPRQGSPASSASNPTKNGGSRGAAPARPLPPSFRVRFWAFSPRHDEQCGVLGFAPRHFRCLNPKPEPGNPFRLKKQPESSSVDGFDGFDGVLPPPMLWMSMLPRDRDQKHQIRPILDGFPARIVS